MTGLAGARCGCTISSRPVVRSPTSAVPSGSTASPHGRVSPIATTLGSSAVPASGPPGWPGAPGLGALRLDGGCGRSAGGGPSGCGTQVGSGRSASAAALQPVSSSSVSTATSARHVRLMPPVSPAARELPVSPPAARP